MIKTKMVTNTPGRYENLYFIIYKFKTRRLLKQWARRHKLEPCRYRVATVIEWRDCHPDMLGTLIISDENKDIGTLAHEAVHMAKIYVRRKRQSRDEEALAYAVGDMTENLLWHRRQR